MTLKISSISDLMIRILGMVLVWWGEGEEREDTDEDREPI
jgi:hypothetical protein